jgi:hypothetical protein
MTSPEKLNDLFREWKMNAFVMMPYKEPYETIYHKVVARAVESCGLKSVIVKDKLFVGSIPEKIHELIKDASICIADLTEANPNVMYEVGVAIALKRSVVFITQGDFKSIPFDIRHYRIVQYKLGEAGLADLYDKLVATLRATKEFGGSPTELIRQMLVPLSLGDPNDGLYVVAASPLSRREASRSEEPWNKGRPLGTYSDHIGVRGLMQSFGLIFGLDRLPELLSPNDFDNEALLAPCHLYSIASPKANWLTGMIMKLFFEKREPKWEFKPNPETGSLDLRNPKLIIRLNDKPYQPAHCMDGENRVWDFGLVIRGPHPANSDYMFMVMAGRSTRGTEASCLAVTDSKCVEKLQRALAVNRINPDNHKDAFCAVVSICAKDGNLHLGPDTSTFKVEHLVKYV